MQKRYILILIKYNGIMVIFFLQNNKPLPKPLRAIQKRPSSQEHQTVSQRVRERGQPAGRTKRFEVLVLGLHSCDICAACRLQYVRGGVQKGTAEHVDHEAMWQESRLRHLPHQQALEIKKVVEGVQEHVPATTDKGVLRHIKVTIRVLPRLVYVFHVYNCNSIKSRPRTLKFDNLTIRYWCFQNITMFEELKSEKHTYKESLT